MKYFKGIALLAEDTTNKINNLGHAINLLDEIVCDLEAFEHFGDIDKEKFKNVTTNINSLRFNKSLLKESMREVIGELVDKDKKGELK